METIVKQRVQAMTEDTRENAKPQVQTVLSCSLKVMPMMTMMMMVQPTAVAWDNPAKALSTQATAAKSQAPDLGSESDLMMTLARTGVIIILGLARSIFTFRATGLGSRNLTCGAKRI